MANISNNLLNNTVSAADDAAIREAIKTVETGADPYLHPLTDEERDRLTGLDVDNKIFCDEARQEVANNGGILPAAVNLTYLDNDLTLYEQMDEYESVLQRLLKRVQDTKRLAGHEAYCMALAAYTLFRSLADAGVEGARQSADRLGERFRRGGRPQDGGNEQPAA